jgi:drug/metabolite transporter (DMT)-like permease
MDREPVLGSIDGLDIVSLLLGAALAYAASISLGRRLWGGEMPIISRTLIVVGAGILLGYAISEVVHALQAARS